MAVGRGSNIKTSEFLVKKCPSSTVSESKSYGHASHTSVRCRLLLAGYRVPFSLALAGLSFRLVGLYLAFSLGRWVSAMRDVFGRGGRPNGMVHLLFVASAIKIRRRA